ncbi:hypothetical protein MHU86_1864 [Fragilaria crotonensis]|nr:hypothetical protein MHU86_1864 [Fragilaria crotonensis]
MIVGVALKAAATGIAATLAACSATNMYQTHTLLQLRTQTFSCPAATPTSPETPIATDLENNNNDADYQLRSAEQTVDQLTSGGVSSRRRELLQLFLGSQAPSIDDIQGEWTGILLDNNSWVMTTVTAVITHKLFGRGRQWRGKLIRDNWTGINRFSGDQGSIEMAHEFQFQIGPSKLDGSPSLKHDYALSSIHIVTMEQYEG